MHGRMLLTKCATMQLRMRSSFLSLEFGNDEWPGLLLSPYELAGNSIERSDEPSSRLHHIYKYWQSRSKLAFAKYQMLSITLARKLLI